MIKNLFLISTIITLSSFTTVLNNGKEPMHTAYEPGEELKYLLYYGWIHGGEASLKLENSQIEGKEIYHAKAIARTIGWADAVYKVNDVYESYFDEKTGKPVLAIRNISENKYRFYDEVKFFHQKGLVESKRKGVVQTPSDIFDFVSAFYYSRKALFCNLQDGDTIRMNTFFEDKVYPVTVRYRGKDLIKTKAGKFNALKFSPVVEVGRIFDSPDDMTFWVSDDKNYLPLRIQFDLLVGSLKCDLIEYKGVKNPLSKL